MFKHDSMEFYDKALERFSATLELIDETDDVIADLCY